MNLAFKRALDVLAGGVLLAMTLPVQAAIAVAVRSKMGPPVLFRQLRPGLHGEPFELLKFRTMRPEDPTSTCVDDARRVTTFGRWLRSTSLDELPSLWNVFRGDMSLVGPRPLLLDYLGLYSPEQTRRHQMRPGVTGLAQVSGRNSVSWDRRLAMDVLYVDSWSIMLDLKILTRTVGAVLRREGISERGEATMTRFRGSDAEQQVSR